MSQSTNLPKKIDPDLILSAVVEIRFESQIPDDQIFNFYFQLFGAKYPNIKSENYLQQQENTIQSNPNNITQNLTLKNIQGFSFSNNQNPNLSLIGTNYSLAFRCNKPYVGWEQYQKFIHKIITQFLQNERITTISYCGLRYTNILDTKLDPNKAFNIQNQNEYLNQFNLNKILLQFSKIDQNNNQTQIQIMNPTTLNTHPSTIYAVLDIAVYNQLTNKTKDSETLLNLFEEQHNLEKEAFCSLLNQDLLNSLKPQY